MTSFPCSIGILRRKPHQAPDLALPMKGIASMPAMHKLGRSGGLTTKFLRRRRTTTDRLFTELQSSPLHDLAFLAQPGITSRVSRNNSVATSLHELGMAFDPVPDVEAVIVIEGGYTPALVYATVVGVLGAMCYGFSLGVCERERGGGREGGKEIVPSSTFPL